MALILVALLILPLIAVVFDLFVKRLDNGGELVERPQLRIASGDSLAVVEQN